MGMDLFAAIRAHAAWKGKLFTALSGGEAVDGAAASADDRCDLGRWLAAEAGAHAGDPAWQRLVERHRAFHRAVGGIVGLVAEGRRTEALQHLFAPDYEQTTHAVVEALIAVHERRGGDHA